ncbi:MAG: cytochrome c [Bacteroidales bacterium]
MKYYILSAFTLLLLGFNLTAQEWEAPADRSARLSPFEFTDETRSAGETIFNTNCKSCHGNPGQADYQRLNPLPGDPAEEKIQSNSDGSLQYKISEGKGLMPSFKNVLTIDDIWKVISYLRSFNKEYVQSVAVVQQLKDLRWSEIKIVLGFNGDKGIVTATLSGLEGERWTPVPETEVMLSAKRYFGMLEIDEPKTTDENGIASFTFPNDLPSDREGKVALRAVLTNQEIFGTISKDTVVMAGIENNAPSLTEKRAMWNIGHKAPIWLLIAYPVGVLLVWGMILYVVLQLRTVYKEGNDEDEL